MVDESSIWVIESPVTMVEGEAVAYSIDWQGASNIDDASVSLTVYKNGEDVSSTVVDTEDNFVVNSNVLTLKKITAQSTDGGERYVVVVQADVDGNTERRKLLIRIVKDEAE
ncbi:MAG: hypothetical protein DWQ07_23270 [Chloroflexi bacterium]|nr:MAG: hypothetical protein DWQ07_23270 [Chloroflexota bacterium]MBL1194071.1 hypothetical protein [Chloroflexota bacterium]NOH11365.1 hypothetical protein [Chloroflexota bacterium]